MKNDHEDHCKGNFIGTSSGMEVAGALNLFHRSLELYNVKYTDYLSDDDSNAYKAVSDLQSCVADVIINKLKCIGHVQKGMGARLRTLKLKQQKTS
uniref:Mutator-like transposase domain-containing protein n=1 Tax=Timema cristinae TaxID=61476 RepID=A0A7R9D9Q7_TIMCR|nr:unnamed protein product [Timema cristinae]